MNIKNLIVPGIIGVGLYMLFKYVHSTEASTTQPPSPPPEIPKPFPPINIVPVQGYTLMRSATGVQAWINNNDVQAYLDGGWIKVVSVVPDNSDSSPAIRPTFTSPIYAQSGYTLMENEAGSRVLVFNDGVVAYQNAGWKITKIDITNCTLLRDKFGNTAWVNNIDVPAYLSYGWVRT